MSRPSPRCARALTCVLAIGFAVAPPAVANPSVASAACRWTEPRAGGESEMVRLLQAIASRSTLTTNPFANGERADHLARLEKTAGEDLLRVKVQLGHQSLLAGRNTAAIEEFSFLRDALGRAGGRLAAAAAREIDGQLAISYMRLAEQQNCILHHSIDACLLPIRGAGVHDRPAGMRAAIPLLTSMLASRPGDLASRWLLNIAYQAVGEYPDGVPEAWRIPPQAFRSDYPLPRFKDVAPGLGVAVRELSGGVALEDFDGDGRLDILASSWGARDPLRLFVNDGHGGFVEATETAGLAGQLGGLNLVHADYDNDGDRDMLVLRGAWLGRHGDHPNSLLRNDGAGRFTDVTRDAGLLSFHPTQTAAWGDYNNDGWLDLYVGNETTRGSVHDTQLYVSNRDGTFRDVASLAGVRVRAFVKGVVWGDYDGDGRLDLYVSTIKQPNLLFRNLGPDEHGVWRFEERAAAAGVDQPVESFPTWFFDYDNDGLLDLFVSGYSMSRYGRIAADVAADHLGIDGLGERPRLYRNDGDGTFTDVAVDLGLDQALYTMGCNFGDLDNDGWLDFYLGTGEPDLRGLVPNKMFRNDGGRRFQDVTTAGGFGHLQKGHGIAFGDLDDDGDQDIYAVMGGAHEGDVFYNALFENPGSEHRWVTLELQGVESNRDAIGARIRIVVNGPDGPREVHATVGSGGSFGSSSLRQEIGLGEAEKIERVEVRWPGSGRIQVFDDVPLDRRVRLTEGRERVEIVEIRPIRLGGGD